MGFRSISVGGVATLFETLYEQEQVDDAAFSFYLPKESGATTGRLVLGGSNPNYYTGDLKYYPVTNQTYWVIAMDSFNVKGTSVNVAKAIVDTGTSLIVGSTTLINQINALIGTVDATCAGIESLPDVTVSIGGDSYVLKSKDYVLQVSALGQSQCLSGFMAMDGLPWNDTIILGDVFLKTYYTVFDITHTRVGFATAK